MKPEMFENIIFCVKDHVRVIGNGHPHFGKEGIITETLGVNTNWGEPRAMIRLDDGTGFIIVTFKNLGPAGKIVRSGKQGD